MRRIFAAAALLSRNGEVRSSIGEQNPMPTKKEISTQMLQHWGSETQRVQIPEGRLSAHSHRHYHRIRLSLPDRSSPPRANSGSIGQECPRALPALWLSVKGGPVLHDHRRGSDLAHAARRHRNLPSFGILKNVCRSLQPRFSRGGNPQPAIHDHNILVGATAKHRQAKQKAQD